MFVALPCCGALLSGAVFAIKEMEWRCIRDGLSKDGRRCKENPVVELKVRGTGGVMVVSGAVSVGVQVLPRYEGWRRALHRRMLLAVVVVCVFGAACGRAVAQSTDPCSAVAVVWYVTPYHAQLGRARAVCRCGAAASACTAHVSLVVIMCVISRSGCSTSRIVA